MFRRAKLLVRHAWALLSGKPTFRTDDPASQERILRLAEAGAPDRERWSRESSYSRSWASRARLAATLIPSGIRVLELGVGAGDLRTLLKDRVAYVGTDLEPLHPDSIPLDLDNDPLPTGPFDLIVALGVLEYLHHVDAAIAKIAASTQAVVVSYCCVPSPRVTMEHRLKAGWVNGLTETELLAAFRTHGLRLAERKPYRRTRYVNQIVFKFVHT